MKLILKNPLAIYDLETTGVSVSNDRIIEMAVIKLLPDGSRIDKTFKVNPGIPIPEESSMIHGIYTKDVKDLPTFGDVAKEVHAFLKDCDLAGFNILKFDAPLLMEEFNRVGVDFSISGRKIIDAQKIFHLMEKRTLGAAYEFYCGKTLNDAHNAFADTHATMEVILSQVDRYMGKSVVDSLGNEMGTIDADVDSLHKVTAHNMVDLAGRMVMNSENVEVFNFGKFKNKPVEDILRKEPGFYDWMMKGDFPIDTKKKLTEIKLRGFNAR